MRRFFASLRKTKIERSVFKNDEGSTCVSFPFLPFQAIAGIQKHYVIPMKMGIQVSNFKVEKHKIVQKVAYYYKIK